MKFNDELTGLIGLAIGAAVIGLVAAREPLSRDNIVREIERQGRDRGDGVEEEVFLKAAELVSKGV
ncbi:MULTISPECIES: hypothetical protein [Kosakonia]|jgi:hypothetical protein|uniref:hypothetical protein n=1 Tax=Kosakonia TaxID=1330547 RepID=UPI000347B587|nr:MULTISPECIES: hypothetical protein [Kosakonia]MBS5774240.1 hypothetical protein [Enterobacter cloacae]MDT3411214.1 hypothetical protein [Atlantibacter sp. SORGH_AS_0304]MBK0018230.1 hypothetical protein [Kosakonia sp. S42]MBK0081969.1 hypothetical protein [Kosakonia sp. S57]MBK0088931.1 hypothetical protein [Kosakonia sp. S58]